MDPPAAREQALAVLAGRPDPRTRSYAQQALGIVLRDQGDVPAALVALRDARRAATASGDDQRLADVLATSGGTLVVGGRSREGLRSLDRATDLASGALLAKVLMRRALVLAILDRPADALDDMLRAMEGVRGSGDRAWVARTLHNLGHVQLMLGRLADAEAAFTEAEELCRGTGYAQGVLHAQTSLAHVALLAGDLPRALARYAALRRDDALTPSALFDAVVGEADAHLAAGLAVEAVLLLEEGLLEVRLTPPDQAELRLLLAQARLAAGEAEEALVEAQGAVEALRALDRPWFTLRAELAAVRARVALGRTEGLGPMAARVAEEMDADGAPEATEALVLAARVAGSARAADLLTRAARHRRHGPALVRTTGWWAEALAAELDGSRGRVLRACGRGLDALDEHRRTLGSSELRARAAARGDELAALAVRHAASDPRSLLAWSERWRATALAQPPVTAGTSAVPETLAALRDLDTRLAEARAHGGEVASMERERAALERAARAAHLQQPGSAAADAARTGVDELVSAVGRDCLLELVDVDGTLHLLVVHAGRVRRRVVGPVAEALALAETAAAALRRAARGRPWAPGSLPTRLQEALLGPDHRLPEGPVVVVPPAALHGVPWGLLPALSDRPVSVSPSATTWLRARDAAAGVAGRPTVLVAGPGLPSGGAEVDAVAALRPSARVLRGPAATVAATLDALDGAGLVHLACHGAFRADSPLFSRLELADGPVTVYDLERLRRAPHRVVLSACESGVLRPVGSGELLGLSAALLAQGTAGLVAAVAEVGDDASVALMTGLHAHLADGRTPAEAVAALRTAAVGDPVAEAAAAAYTVVGA